MTLAMKALWVAEGMLEDDDASLGKIASRCGASRHHLARAFGAAYGRGLMSCLRARRLSEAARALAAGGTSVTDAGLTAGYDAPGAFTRAFRAEFGCAPSDVLRRRSLDVLTLTDPHQLEIPMPYDLPTPRFEERPAFHVTGLVRRYQRSEVAGIPALWAEFTPHIPAIADRRGEATYGVCISGDGAAFDYMACVESGGGDVGGLETRVVPAGRFAVFTIDGHVSDLHRAMHAIFSEWLPASDYDFGASFDFERYDARFDPETGNGLIEVWVPITPR